MGRIAYLSKRGNNWWFRRRHPAIAMRVPQNPQGLELCGILKRKAQAKGHLAISLRTSSPREARRLGAILSNHFERAWAVFEQQANSMIDDDTLDAMARLLTDKFRSVLGQHRTMGVAGMAPALRERSFAILDAELREAFGIEVLPDGDLFKRVEVYPRVRYIAFHPLDPDRPMTDEQEWIERMADEETIDNDPQNVAQVAANWTFPDPAAHPVIDKDDEADVERLESMALGLGHLLNDYLGGCEKHGLDPKTEMQSSRKIAESLHKAAVRLGLPVTATTPSIPADANEAKPAFSTELFTAYAAQYLRLRSQGYTLRREDEAPHAATGHAFERTSLRNWQSSVRVFSQIVGDLPLSEIGKAEVIEFNTVIQRLPANFGKSSRDMRTARQFIEDADEAEPQDIAAAIERLSSIGKSNAEIVDAAANVRIRRISATTIKRHQTALQSMFDHALRQHMIGTNPFKGRILTEAEVKRQNRSAPRILRDGWGDSIHTLLGSKAFRGLLADVGDPLFWAPLIAVFAGLRLQEICQLRVGDFTTKDDIPFVLVQNSLGTQLIKTENSHRGVPLHRALIEIGLPELIAFRRQQKAKLLFPDMPRSKSIGTLSPLMSKRFGNYIRSQGIQEQGLDFHALRTDFHTRLARAKVPDHVRKGLMGHEQTDVTHLNYFRAGETAEDLLEYVNRIDIDYHNIRRPFGKPLPV